MVAEWMEHSPSNTDSMGLTPPVRHLLCRDVEQVLYSQLLSAINVLHMVRKKLRMYTLELWKQDLSDTVVL